MTGCGCFFVGATTGARRPTALHSVGIRMSVVYRIRGQSKGFCYFVSALDVVVCRVTVPRLRPLNVQQRQFGGGSSGGGRAVTGSRIFQARRITRRGLLRGTGGEQYYLGRRWTDRKKMQSRDSANCLRRLSWSWPADGEVAVP